MNRKDRLVTIADILMAAAASARDDVGAGAATRQADRMAEDMGALADDMGALANQFLVLAERKRSEAILLGSPPSGSLH